jgi:hypothetical protein
MSHNDTRTQKGVSLARGPALIIGTVLLIAGLYFLYKQHTFVKLSQFPSGHATYHGKVFLGIFGVNGWSGELTAAGGGLLLFGAAQHLLAKAMSLIVGVVLAVIAIWALVHSHSAAGLFAANIWTIIGWGGCAALLLFNTVIPRRSTQTEAAPAPTVTHVRAPAPDPEPAPEPPPVLPEGGSVRVRPSAEAPPITETDGSGSTERTRLS